MERAARRSLCNVEKGAAMPRFFIQQSAVSGNDGESKIVRVTGSDAHHIARSLRMMPGDALTVCDMQKTEYLCKILSVCPDCVTAEVAGEYRSETEPPYRARLYQAAVKGDKMDVIIQKAVETGVSEIVPVHTERCVARIPVDAAGRKLERWRKIAEEAAKQCGRGIIPEVRAPVTFRQAVTEASRCAIPLFCYEGDGTRPLREVLRASAACTRGEEPDISILVGPEGGFSMEETASARDAGMALTGLGRRILRTETASAFVLACLVYELEAAPDGAQR